MLPALASLTLKAGNMPALRVFGISNKA